MEETDPESDVPDGATLFQALEGGDPAEVRRLIGRGADLHFVDGDGYGALLHATHGRDVFLDSRLLELLQLLIDQGVDLNEVSAYGESGLGVLSRLGRFDAVRLLLEAGADEWLLKWTPLIRAVALGTLEEVRACIDRGVLLEERDRWSRTAWLVAVQSGDLAKARLLAERGANLEAVARCGQPALFHAVVCHRTAMLEWLVDLGFNIEQEDDFGGTTLINAAEVGHAEGVEVLLRAGARIDHGTAGNLPLNVARRRDILVRLLDAGADPQELGNEGRRILMGLPADPYLAPLQGVTRAEFSRAATRRFGSGNPERMDEPFWIGMIRSGVRGYDAAVGFKVGTSQRREPIWCAQRFGQSLTLLPDGRGVLIGGEHEDRYDPDFCIYNDVIVREADGSLTIHGYPEAVFAPTDFHTATRIDNAIYLIGSLGYAGRREYGQTPVYRLEIGSWRIKRMECRGEGPGWIHRHRATWTGGGEIRVTGGEVLTQSEGEERASENGRVFVLDVDRCVWTVQDV